MKSIFSITLIMGILLAACAPTTSDKDNEAEKALKDFKWTVIKEPAINYFDLQASLNAAELPVEVVENTWLVKTDNLKMTISLADKPVLSFVTENDLVKYKNLYEIAKPTLSSSQQTHYSPTEEIFNLTQGSILTVGPEGFVFSLQNNSDHSIKLIWDESAIILPNGDTSRIMHEGVRFSDRNVSQLPSTIPSGGKLDDLAKPSSNVEYNSLLEKWMFSPLIDTIFFAKGESITLFLTLEIAGEKQELDLKFISRGYNAVKSAKNQKQRK